METLHPGVYLQEVSSGVRPIEGVSTSTAAFIGPAEKGPLGRALMVTSFAEFETTYGGFFENSWLAQSALAFFNNGGRRLYVVRVAKDAETASVTLKDRKRSPDKTLTIAANSPGKWGNTLVVDIDDGSQDPSNEFKLSVKREISPPPNLVVTSPLETFDNLSMNPDNLNFVENVVNPRSKYIRVTVDPANTSTERGSSQSGTDPLKTQLPTGNRNLLINIDGDGQQLITLADPVTNETQIKDAIITAVHNLSVLRRSTSPFSSFTADFDANNNVYKLSSGTIGSHSSVEVTDAPAGNAAALLKLGRANGGIEQTGAAALRPANGTNIILGVSAGFDHHPGSDGKTPQPAEYGPFFSLLDAVHDVNLIAAPGISSVVGDGASYCQQRADCFFIGDMDGMDDTKETAQDFVRRLANKSSYAAVYFPWVKAIDARGASTEPVLLPPSGYVAGIFARTDARRGVWKAPAGVEANLGGAVGLQNDISDADQDTLNPIGANAIRAFPAAGMVVWGARTLATQSDPEYKYVPVRRTAIFLEQSIYRGIQWAVFEPNDENLWSSLRLNINAFMLLQFRAGAFQGRTANEAFFVQCDHKTTTQADIDAGIVNIFVGFAPLKPAEFVVLRLSQKAGQPTI